MFASGPMDPPFQGDIFRYETKLYYSPNWSRTSAGIQKKAVVPPPPLLPESTQNPFVPGLEWKVLAAPCRWTHAYAWAAFIPLQRVQMYPFDRLLHIPPMVWDASSRNYSLPSSIVQSWDSLGYSLHELALKFIAVYSIPAVLPYSARGWGYHKGYSTPGMARARAHRAADWFMVWAGLMAYLISFIEKCRSTLPDGFHHSDSFIHPAAHVRPLHWKALMREAMYPPAWIDGLECLARSTVERAGLFFSSLEEGFSNTPSMEFFDACGIHYWYEVTPEVFVTMAEDKAKYLPRQGLSIRIEDYPDNASSRPTVSMITGGDGARKLEVQKDATQEEYWNSPRLQAERKAVAEDIFQGLRERDNRIKAKQSPEQVRGRLQREKEPPTASATVYIWEQHPDEPARLVQATVRAAERVYEIGRHGPRQKAYFSGLNAWHLCEDLAFGEGAESDDEYDEEGDLPFYPTPAQAAGSHVSEAIQISPTSPSNLDTDSETSSPPPSEPVNINRPHSPPPDTFIAVEKLPELFVHTASTGADSPEVITTMVDQIYSRLVWFYGYLRPVPLPDVPQSQFPSRQLNEAAQQNLMRSIGFSRDRAGIPGFLSTPDAYFFWKFASKFTSKTSSSNFEGMFDLERSSRFPLGLYACRERLRTVNRLSPLPPLYVLGLDGAYDIGVDCPMLAAAVLRICGRMEPEVPTEKFSEAIAEVLHDNGCRFHTLFKVEATIPSPLPKSYVSLPERPIDYVFSASDYHAYEAMLSGLLRIPRMRAAALQGGYTWRLSLFHLSKESIIAGPVSCTQNLATAEGISYIDNALSDLEVALLIGTYKVPTTRAGQFVEKSWWPPVDIFESFGDYSGMWSSYLEVGFRARVRAIEKGTAEPLSRKEWKKQKGFKGARIWRQTLCVKSKKFIEEFC